MTAQWEAVPRTYDPLKAGSIDGTDVIPHDHGIVRAIQAEYKPNKLVVGDPKATIFVGRLSPKTDESTLTKVFSEIGDIKRLRLIRDIVTGFSKGYAFIEYYNKYDAVAAVRLNNHMELEEKTILVEFECERILTGWIPRRLGGGLSGKKESGQLRFGGKERPFKQPISLISMKEKNRQLAADHFNRDRHRPRERNNWHDSYSRKRRHHSRD